MKFTERFKEILKTNNVKQTKLANYLGISRQCITDYKSGKSVPSIETLYNICKYLDCTSDYLLGLSDF